MKNKCRIIVGIMLLFLISCKTETVSDDEYEVLNLFVNQILEPKVVEIESPAGASVSLVPITIKYEQKI